nr:unnamed protein product [Brassica oleracea]
MTNPVEETDAPVSVSIVPGTEEGNPQRKTAMLKVLDRVSKSSFVGAWRVYIKKEVVLPGVSLALLFFTVLSFGTLMTATLQWEGIPTYVIGIG